ncbi:hypothetical protein BG011_002822, partial [Mortierella polycephala]
EQQRALAQRRSLKQRRALAQQRVLERQPPSYRSHLLHEQHKLRPDMEAVQVPITDTVGPVRFLLAETQAIARIRDTPVDNTSPRIISSDGSMINAATTDVAMAFDVVDFSQPKQHTVQGRTDGFASSAKAELMGLLAAIPSMPPDQDIIVEFGNQAVVQQYQQQV